MVKVTVLFPAGEGRGFNVDYYATTHRALCQDAFGAALLRFEIEKGLSGPFPGSEPPNLAIGHLYFASVDAVMAALMPNASRLMKDFPNFTNTSPIIQISEVIP